MSGNSEGDSGARLLLLDDGRPGHWRQVSALAAQLDLSARRIELRLLPPWRWLAPRRLPLGLAVHGALRRSLPVEPPRAVISCGRRSALVLRWLADYWPERPLTVQILHCGIDPRHFDWLITPRHDAVSAPNVIRTLGSLNPVDEKWLSCTPEDPVRTGPEPHVVLLLGGRSRHFDLSPAWLEEHLAPLAGTVHRAGGSLEAVASPRTPGWARDEFTKLTVPPVRRFTGWRADETGAGSYRAALSRATHFVVTADSVNLLSEACATGRPVCVLGAERVRGRIADFVRTLLADGYAHPAEELAGVLAGQRACRRLRETPAVAVRLRRSGGLGQGTHAGLEN
ncbi:mitochondrial fission ELM1 family protein [Elongatibacter sediminis]|uniref:Mitochondrial fission ELM1 family protein n=1 Tax=Elongatibacter sediminis TaxID=3119006 RepID=A0AAW9RIR3_9GAMM